MPAELVSHRRQQLRPKRLALPRPKPRLQRRRYHRRRHRQLYGLLHRPPALARILHIRLYPREIAVFFQRRRRQVQQPRPHHAAMPPDLGYLRQVKLQIPLRLHQLKPLRKRLHHPVLDAVVNHLDEMPRARRPHAPMPAAFARRKRLEHRLQPLICSGIPAYHQAISLSQPPHAAACAGVKHINAALPQRRRPRYRLLVIGIPPVYNRIPLSQPISQFPDSGVGNLPRRNHHPNRPRRIQHPHHLRDGRRARRARALSLAPRPLVRIIRHNPMAAQQQPLRHIPPHSPQPDHSQFHSRAFLIKFLASDFNSRLPPPAHPPRLPRRPQPQPLPRAAPAPPARPNPP